MNERRKKLTYAMLARIYSRVTRPIAVGRAIRRVLVGFFTSERTVLRLS